MSAEFGPHPAITDHHWDGSTVGGTIFRKDLLSKSHNPQRPLRTHGNDGVMEYNNNTDLPRMRAGLISIAYANACPFPFDPRTSDLGQPENFEAEYQLHADIYNTLAKVVPDQVGFASTAQELQEVTTQGKIAMIRSIEGLQLSGDLASDIALLNKLINEGVRNFGPMWNMPNVLGTPCYAEESTGLSEYGKDIVGYLVDHGMIIDLSHSNAKTARDILKVAPADQVIATHVAAGGLTNHPRNLPDDVLEQLPLVGVPFVAPFVKTDAERQANIDDVVRHLVYLKRLIGADRIGLGPDFGGSAKRSAIAGLDNVAVAGKNLYQALKDSQEFSEEEIAGIFGENGRRYLETHLPK